MLQKYYENGVIVFCVERSFRMCVTDFCLEKGQIPHEDKILNPQLAVAPSLRHHRWLSSCRMLSRGAARRSAARSADIHSTIAAMFTRARSCSALSSPPWTGKALPSRDRRPTRAVALGRGRSLDVYFYEHGPM